MARAGRWVAGASTIMLYMTTSDLRCGSLGLHEGCAIFAGTVLVARMSSSVILLGRNVERFPFKLKEN